MELCLSCSVHSVVQQTVLMGIRYGELAAVLCHAEDTDLVLTSASGNEASYKEIEEEKNITG